MANKGLQVLQSGERTNAAGKPVSNKILLSICDRDYGSLRPHLEYVSLPNHLVIHEADGKLEFAYFPNRGLISLVVVMNNGKTAEAGIVGNEGFTGTLAAVGLSHYTKYEYRVPMRDGVRLFAAVYVPKDVTQTYPILMQRKPYNVGPR